MNICIFSGSRSEYGLLKILIKLLSKDKYFKTDLIVSGSHLSKKYGFSIKEILQDKISIKKKIFLNLKSSSTWSVCNNFSILNFKANNFFKNNKYNCLILLGDRYETLSLAIAAYINRIPIVHIHGGEKTEDSLDDNYRHAISKFSNFHFVSHQSNKNRLIQLGEDPKSIKIVGGLGASSISKLKLLTKKELFTQLKINPTNKTIVINFYPEISNINKSIKTLKYIFKIINDIEKINCIFTVPSHDIGNDQFQKLILDFTKSNKNYFFFKNLGQLKFLSLLNASSLLIGNSSSGIFEMPSFGKYSINVGKRQKGRIFSKTVIQCDPKIDDLRKKINIYLNKKIIKKTNKNIYYKKYTYENIYKFLRNNKLNTDIKKFRDL